MPSTVDEQPPSRPDRPRPEPARRRPSGRSRATASRSGAATRNPDAPRRRPAAAPPRRPRGRRPVADDQPRPAPSQKRLVILLSVLTAVVLVGAGLVFALTSGGSGGDDALPAPAPDSTPAPVTTFSDPETGFTVEYPRAWQRVQVPVADYRLAVDGGNNVAFTIRVVPIQVPATTQNLENFKAVTDGLVGSNSTVQVLKQQAISLNGMLGYYYFYTFSDGPVQAVHAHYFLFSGHKMNILVFQSLPDDFEKLASTFDKIAESFRSDPNVPPTTTAPAPTTTTVAP